MAKSGSNVSFEKHGQENDGQSDDQQATTSKESALKVCNTFDNMDDLEPMDFNSADTVRQTMKAIFAGRVPPSDTNDVNHSHGQDTSASIKINEVARNQFHTMGKYNIRSENPGRNTVRATRPKRQSKTDYRYVAGPSKVKRPPKRLTTTSDLYLGKLSNVVPFGRRWQSESDSDTESAVLSH